MDDADKAQEIEEAAKTIMEPYAEVTEALQEHYTVFIGIMRTENGWEDILIEEEYCV